MYHQTLTHRKHAYEVSASAATAFFDANVKVICSTTAAEVVAAFNKFEDHFCRNYGLEKQNMELWLDLISFACNLVLHITSWDAIGF